jgi:thymidylate kinase
MKMRHLKPRLIAQLRCQPDIVVVDPHGKPPRGAFLSLLKIFVWLMEEWFATLFLDARGTHVICDRYYHDLLVDPQRYRFGASLRMARWMGKLMPRPALWILLDAPAATLRERKQEVSLEETVRQAHAYREFVRAQPGHVILDASRPLDDVIAAAAQAIAEAVMRYESNCG